MKTVWKGCDISWRWSLAGESEGGALKPDSQARFLFALYFLVQIPYDSLPHSLAAMVGSFSNDTHTYIHTHNPPTRSHALTHARVQIYT